MLWRLKNFKGIESAAVNIEPGKATILTGVNSSGKSSIIQSILLAAQSLHSDGPLVLNGPLVRLGDAEDLVREDSPEGSVLLGLELETSTVEDLPHLAELSVEYELVPAPNNATLQPRRLEITPRSPDARALRLAHANSRASDVEIALRAASRHNPSHALHIKSLLGSASRQLRTYVVMRGLRAVALVQLMDQDDVKEKYARALDALLDERVKRAPLDAAATTRVGRGVFLREFVRLMGEGARGTKSTRLRRAVERFGSARTGNPALFRKEWEQHDEEVHSALIEIAAEARARRPYALLQVRNAPWNYSSVAGGLLESALENTLGDTYGALGALGETLDLVAERVQYLGPLRDEPRVVWNHWNELARSLPVGTRGEYSAAVLSRANTTPVQYTTPKGKRENSTLGTALDDWLAYLEIGSGVSARSHGKLGVGLDLKVADHVRDLTAVGVGVSQALPLLVGLLVAPRNALFIVEQPELHLHPSVQARIADFLLTARPDLALLIETHSDAFVTRVRRRVAEGAVPVERVDVTFVEPGRRGSNARSLQLSEFGDLAEWPRGFLSSAEEDVRAIMQANLTRIDGRRGKP